MAALTEFLQDGIRYVPCKAVAKSVGLSPEYASIIPLLIDAFKEIWAKVMALVQSDEAQNARIQQLEEEVAALKSAAGAPGAGFGAPAVPPPADAGTSGQIIVSPKDDSTATTTVPGMPAPLPSDSGPDAAETEMHADTPNKPTQSETATPSPPQPTNDTLLVDTAPETEPTPQPEPQAANDNSPAEDLPATGTE
jgi:hypothetical protein